MAKTLVHYFVGVIPKGFSKSIGADYDAELSKFPAWAIVKARRWWLSSDNEYRHRKPMPGDLSERAEGEIWLLGYAERAVRDFDAGKRPDIPEATRTPLTGQDAARRKAEADAIMSGAGKLRK